MRPTMKSMLLGGAAALALGAATPAMAQGAGPTSAGTNAGFYMNAEFLYGQLFGGNLQGVNISQNNYNNSSEQQANWGPGFRIGGGFRTGSNWDMGMALSFLQGNLQSQSGRSFDCCFNVYTPVGAGDFGAVSGNWQRWMFDVDAGYNTAFAPYLNVRWSAGLRYLNLRVQQNARGAGDPNITSDGSYNGSVRDSFTGIGPRFGADATIRLGQMGNGPVSFIAGAGASLLMGSQRVRYNANFFSRGSFSGTDSFSTSSNSVVPMLDATMALRWETMMGRLPVAFTLGYRADVMMGVQSNMGSSGGMSPNFVSAAAPVQAKGPSIGGGGGSNSNIGTQTVYLGVGISF